MDNLPEDFDTAKDENYIIFGETGGLESGKRKKRHNK
jgi:hypothetical protein